MPALRLCALLMLASAALAGAPTHEHGEDVEDTPLAPVVAPHPTSTRKAADFSNLTDARIGSFLKQQQALARVLRKDPELGERVSDIAQRARDGGDRSWEPEAREPAIAGPMKKAVGADAVEYFRTHALVAAAYDQYVATQELAALDRAPARAELARARVQARSGRAKGGKEHGRVLVEQAAAARRKLEALLIPGFPRSVLSAVQRHEKGLQQAFEDVDEEEGLEPTGAGGPSDR